jgi:hypothetical protein
MAKMQLRELCRRTRLADGNVTYHMVSLQDGRTLIQISESSYREYEALARQTSCLYSRNDKRFTRHFKTVQW